MYKSSIFNPLNLSTIGENAPLIEEKGIDFSLESFKSKESIACPYNVCIIKIIVLHVIRFSIHTCGICRRNLGKIHVVGIPHWIDMDIGIYRWLSSHGIIGCGCSLVL